MVDFVSRKQQEQKEGTGQNGRKGHGLGSDQAIKVRRGIETTTIPVGARDQQRAGRTYVSATSVILGVEHGLDYGAAVSNLICFS